jgi:HAD superfamily hydrolase (TIGR01509 family)
MGGDSADGRKETTSPSLMASAANRRHTGTQRLRTTKSPVDAITGEYGDQHGVAGRNVAAVTVTRGLFDTSLDLSSPQHMAAPVPAIEAVLFDFSNTIFRMIDVGSWLRRIATHTGRVDDLVDPAAMAVMVSALDDALARPDIRAQQVDRDTSSEAHRRAMYAWFAAVEFLRGYEEAAYDIMADDESWQPYPDTEPVLRALRQRGIPLGIVSDIGWDLRIHLARHGLEDLFDAVTMSYEVGVEKPDPRIFLKACSDLGVDPRATLMVGDSPLRDGGANAVGIRAFILSAEHRTGERGLHQVLALVDGSVRPQQTPAGATVGDR